VQRDAEPRTDACDALRAQQVLHQRDADQRAERRQPRRVEAIGERDVGRVDKQPLDPRVDDGVQSKHERRRARARQHGAEQHAREHKRRHQRKREQVLLADTRRHLLAHHTHEPERAKREPPHARRRERHRRQVAAHAQRVTKIDRQNRGANRQQLEPPRHRRQHGANAGADAKERARHHLLLSPVHRHQAEQQRAAQRRARNQTERDKVRRQTVQKQQVAVAADQHAVVKAPDEHHGSAVGSQNCGVASPRAAHVPECARARRQLARAEVKRRQRRQTERLRPVQWQVVVIDAAKESEIKQKRQRHHRRVLHERVGDGRGDVARVVLVAARSLENRRLRRAIQRMSDAHEHGEQQRRAGGADRVGAQTEPNEERGHDERHQRNDNSLDANANGRRVEMQPLELQETPADEHPNRGDADAAAEHHERLDTTRQSSRQRGEKYAE
jgi:hypothetical protein